MNKKSIRRTLAGTLAAVVFVALSLASAAAQDHSGHTGQTGQQPPSPAQGKGSEVQPGQSERLGQVSNPDDTARRKTVPGYPQDMVMFMDKEVAKPQTYGLPPGWTGSFMGMMTMVRVLPPEMYDEVQRRVRAGIVEPPQGQPAGQQQHKHE